MSFDIVMKEEVMDLHNDLSSIISQGPSKISTLKRVKARPYSRRPPTEGATSGSGYLEALMKERAMVLLSLIPADKRQKIGLELRRPAKTELKQKTEKCRPTGQSQTFPYKLWNVIENDTFRSACWSADGTSVVIHEMMFIAEILERDETDRILGMKSIKNFYRQFNVYGFTKLGFCPENHGNPKMDIIGKVKVK